MSSESQNIFPCYLKIFIVGLIAFSAIIDGFCQIPLFKKNAIINLPDNQNIQEEFVSNFDPYVTYYWRIRSILDEGGPGEWSEVFEYTTKSNRVKDFSLDPAYPNPFKKNTTIQFELKTTAFVEIIIFDIHGKEIDLLTSKIYLRGIHKMKWNSEKLPSGLYFCKIKAGTTIQVIKLVLCN